MDVENLNININVNMGNTNQAFQNANRMIDNFQNKLKKMGQGMKNVGNSLTKSVSLPLVGLGVLSLKTAADFETGMNRVEALTSATGEQFKKLKNQAKELGRTTQFSAKEAADGMGFLAQAGFKADEILTAMPSTLQLASSAQMDLGRAADITSNILSGYGLEVKELSMANDVLVKAFTSANMDLTMLGESMKYIGPIAKQQGIQFEETAAAIGILGTSGIQASQAGTSLRQMLLRLAAPPEAAAEALERLGLSAYGVDGNMKSLKQIMTEINTKHKETGASTQQVTQNMKDLFGTIGYTGAAILSSNVDQLGELTTTLENSGGTAQKIADVQMKGLNGAIKALKSAFEGLMIAIAESGLLDGFTDLVKRITPLIQKFAEANPKMLKMITIFGGLGIVLGPIITVIGTLTIAIGAISAPVLAVIAGVSVFIGVLGTLLATTDLLKNFTSTAKDVFITIKENIGPTQEKLLNFLNIAKERFTETFNTISKEILPIFLTKFKEIAPIVINIINQVIDILTFLINKSTSLFNFLLPFIKNKMSGIMNFIKTSLKIIEGIFNVVLGIIKGDWEKVWDGLKQTAINILKTFITFVKLQFNTMYTIIYAVITKLKNIVTSIIKSMVDFVVDKFKWLYNHNYYFKDLVDFIIDKFNFLKNFVKILWFTITSFITNGSSDTSNAVINIFNSMKKIVENVVKDGLKWGKNLVSNITKGIKSKAGEAKEAATNVMSGVAKILGFHSPAEEGPGADADKWSPNLMNMLLDGFDKAIPKFKDVSSDLVESIKREFRKLDTIKKMFNDIREKMIDTWKLTITETKAQLNNLSSVVKTALERQYDDELRIEEEKANERLRVIQETTYKAISFYNDEYNEKVKLLDDESNEAVKKLKDDIERINNRTKKEEKALKEKEYQNKINNLYLKINEAETLEEKEKLQKDYSDLIIQNNRNHVIESRKIQIEGIKKEIDNIKKTANDKKKILQDELKNKIDIKNTELENEKIQTNEYLAFYKDYTNNLKNEDKIYANTRNLLMKENQESLIELLQEYYPKWQNAGQSFADKFMDGFNNIKQNMGTTISNITNQVSTVVNTSFDKTIESTRVIEKNFTSIVDKMKINSIKWLKNNKALLSDIKKTDDKLKKDKSIITGKGAEKKKTSLEIAAERTKKLLIEASNKLKQPLVQANIELAKSIDLVKKSGSWYLPTGQKAYEIPAFANGVNNFKGGPALVGEKGPELLNLPKGSNISSNKDSRNMLETLSITGNNFYIREESDIKKVAKEIYNLNKIKGRGKGVNI